MPEKWSKEWGTAAEENVSPRLWFVLCVFERRADGMFWWLSAYWQASEANANCRANLATSLFTLGIKLKNTASNFIPGLPHHHSQCDIYSLAWCPFSLPLPLTQSLALLLDNTLRSKRGWWRAENDASFLKGMEIYLSMGLTTKSLTLHLIWILNYFSTTRDKYSRLFCPSFSCLCIIGRIYIKRYTP